MNYTTLISSSELTASLHQSDWVIFDCRFSLADDQAGRQAYQQSHIPNAVYVDLNLDLSSPITPSTGRHPLPDFDILIAKLGQWGVNNLTQVVVYDDAGGAFAGRLWWLLKCLGHRNVAVLDGGITHWQNENRELSNTIPSPGPQAFVAVADNNYWYDAEQVSSELEIGAIKLIDARTPERFRGKHEPIDPIAGHIPGALNRAFQNNLDSTGKFLPAKQLRAQFSQFIGNTNPDHVVHMCGSGVTACHNLLAMDIAGLEGSKLYAGSWSEWITNPARAVATNIE